MLLYIGNCSTKVSLLKYKNFDACNNSIQSSLIEIPIVSKNPLNEFTFCGKYMFKFIRETILMYMKESDIYIRFLMSNELDKQIDENVGLLLVDGHHFFFFHNQTLLPDNLYHLCFAKSNGSLKIVLNGELIYNESIAAANILETDSLNTTLFLGGIPKPKWMFTRFEGTIMDVYLWNQPFNINKLRTITSLNNSGKFTSSLLFSWEKFKLSKNIPCIEHENVDSKDAVFEATFTEKVFFLENGATFDSTKYVCNGFGGNLFAPLNINDISKVSNFIQNSEKCHHAFIALRKLDKNIVDLNGKVISYGTWYKGEPNGHHFEKCIAIISIPEFVDINCERKLCFACQMPAKNIFTLRGKIPDNAERSYFIHMTENQTDIRGIGKSEYLWNTTWEFV